MTNDEELEANEDEEYDDEDSSLEGEEAARAKYWKALWKQGSAADQRVKFEKIVDEVTPLAMLSRARWLLLTPHVFFEDLSLNNQLKDSVAYILVIAGICGIEHFFAGEFTAGFLEFFLRVVGAFAGAGFLYIISRGFGGVGTYQQTLRAVAYVSTMVVVFSVQYLNFIAACYYCFLLHLGLRKVHELEIRRTNLVIAMFLVAMIGMIVVTVLLTAAGVYVGRHASGAVDAPAPQTFQSPQTISP